MTTVNPKGRTGDKVVGCQHQHSGCNIVRGTADCDAALSQKIFNIAVTEVEPIVEPDGVTDDIRWKPVTLISTHHQIIDQG